jgi:hypothetical protein
MQREELAGLVLLAIVCTAASITALVFGILRHSTNLIAGAIVLILFSILISVLVVTKCRRTPL